MKSEAAYQSELKKRIKQRWPKCIVLKQDSQQLQGIPDLVLFFPEHSEKYAMLEVKQSQTASHRPNQDYYVELFNKCSFAAFVYPENEAAVLNEIDDWLKS